MLYFNFSNDFKIIIFLLRKNLKNFSIVFLPLIILSSLYVANKKDNLEKSVKYKFNRIDDPYIAKTYADANFAIYINKQDVIEVLQKTHSNLANEVLHL